MKPACFTVYSLKAFEALYHVVYLDHVQFTYLKMSIAVIAHILSIVPTANIF